LYETSNGNIIKAIAIIMQITIKKLLVIEKMGELKYCSPKI